MTESIGWRPFIIWKSITEGYMYSKCILECFVSIPGSPLVLNIGRCFQYDPVRDIPIISQISCLRSLAVSLGSNQLGLKQGIYKVCTQKQLHILLWSHLQLNTSQTQRNYPTTVFCVSKDILTGKKPCQRFSLGVFLFPFPVLHGRSTNSRYL